MLYNVIINNIKYIMGIFTQFILNVAIVASIYILLSLGFSLLYKTTKFFDVGYGILVVSGGYFMYFFYQILNLNLIFSIFLSIIFTGLISLFLEKIIYSKMRKRKSSSLVLFIASLGVFTMLQAIIAILFTSQFKTLTNNNSSNLIFNFYGGNITGHQLIILFSSILLSLIMFFVYKKTIFGKAVRAISEDEEVAKIVGINTDKIISIVFLISGGIAAIAGIAVGFDTGLEPTIGFSLLLKATICVIIGGSSESLKGVIIGAIFLALIENIGAWYFSAEWKDLIAFSVLILFLLFRPTGIFKKSS